MQHKCGCELSIQEVDGHLDTQAFKFCPMHKAAPALLSALEAINDEMAPTTLGTNTLSMLFRQARAAILAAKGEAND